VKLPLIKDVAALIRDLKPTIGDEYRAIGCEEDDTPSMDLTVGCNTETGEWSWQTGDNSYSGGAYSYPIWGVIIIDRRCNSRATARELVNQIAEQASQ
jgi:hypothetical protein